ncbi:glycine--tRNA ligase [bacterium]|uniref:glycine--tRNA ligase n=1 Tax=Candidatus Ventrenecus sp. TaxID=3085654 RepID=UPI001D63593C|nr:glycine--tRNA ligase [bacterium]
MNVTMEMLVNYCKQYGYIFQGSEIYGGLSNTWDYGSLGVELKNNVRKMWWKKFIQENPYNYGLDSAILMNPEVWVASGHVASFADPLIDCKRCKTRHRADKLIEEFTDGAETGDGWDAEKLENYIKDKHIICPNCGACDFTPIRQFNLLFETHQGVTEDTKSKVYLRGETAQGIFVNFLNVQRSMRAKVPFGIGQTGKSFRNEITPGNFTFRTREFEQMELEFFCKPGTDLEWFGYYKSFCLEFLKDLGINKDNLRYRDHEKEELSFYSKATTDIEYKYPMGWGELWGIADRTDYDLSVHQEHSKQDLRYLDPVTNEKYLPYVIEPSVGLDRLVLALLADAYKEEVLENETRLVLKINPALAPLKVTILPLIKKHHSEKAMEIYGDLAKDFMCTYDEAGSIGKRYRRSDAVGTPLCVTVDDETLNNNTVTIRDRDTMEQITMDLNDLKTYIHERVDM